MSYSVRFSTNASDTLGYFDATTTGQSQLIGNESVADRAYYTNNTDGQVYTEAAAAGDLITQDNFPEWDFADTWDWQGDGQWPLLQFQDNSGDDSEISEGEDTETSEGDSDADSDPPLGLCTGVDSSATTLEVNGTDYLIIRDRAGLEAISDNLTAHYILCNDIHFDAPFTPIGGEFTGTLEGNHRIIHRLKIHAENSNYVGLFGKIGRGGKVRSLELSLGGDWANPSISGNSLVGALAGVNRGIIRTVAVTGGYVKGYDRVGGLVGLNYGEITHSYATSIVEGDDDVGGLVGFNSWYGIIRQSYATGRVEGHGYIGGLVGYNYYGGTIIASYFDASTTGQSQLIGNESIEDRAYYTNNTDGQVYTEAAAAGDLITQDNFPEWDFTDTWDWQEDGQWPLLQFQANGGDDSEISEGEDTEISEGDSDPPTPLGLCAGLDASATTLAVDGTDYLIIRDRSGLEAMSDNLRAHYILCNDISLDGTSTQINSYAAGDFTGILEGNGRTISGLKITRSSSNHVGLFGAIGEGGKVRNLSLSLVEGDTTTPSISGNSRVGALAGVNGGIIRNVAVTDGYVKGNSYIGGLVGRNYGEITESYATGSVEGGYSVGGLVGLNHGATITASYATGSVEGGGDNVGGLVGDNRGTITESYATGAVDGVRYIGGLVGDNRGTITESYATGSVDGVRYIGGLVGHNRSGAITASYATGAVEGTGEYIGGLVGYNYEGTITASYATGSVDGVRYIGGLVGHNYGGTITASYATGAVAGTGANSSHIGGLVGYNSYTIPTASYFDAVLTGQSQFIGNESVADRAYYTNNTDGQVYTEAVGTGTLITSHDFPEWDFTDTWDWQEDGQWPLLQFQDNGGDGSGTSEGEDSEIPEGEDSEIPEGEDSEIPEGEDSEIPEGDSDADSDPPLGLCAGLDASATSLEVDGSDYLIIRDQAGLEAIGDDQDSLEAHHILCNDISLDDTFTQINPDAAGEFTGTLEGNHRTIRNLKIHAENSEYVGLFRVIAAGGTVRNLSLSLVEGNAATPSISGKRHVGALAGENKGTITNVRVTGGYIQGEERYTGGLVGSNSDSGTIETSYVTGTVEGDRSVGGLVGYNDGGTIKTSYATGSVEGTGSNIGGLVGYNDNGTVETSYATSSVRGERVIGGLVGWSRRGTITASYAIGSVEGTDESSEYIGGLIGHNSSATITASYFDAITTGQGGAGTAYYTNPADSQVYTEADAAGTLIAQDDFSAWDFDAIWDWQGIGQWPILKFETE